MSATVRPQLSHMGIYVTDLDRMVTFYQRALGMTVTDRGMAMMFPVEVAFLSSDPKQHHQLALAKRRPPEATFSTVMQASFKVGSLDELRRTREQALANGAQKLRGMNHGNSWSVYFDDPEGNTVEVYLDTPFRMAQPFAVPLDLDQSDDDIRRGTELICRQRQ